MVLNSNSGVCAWGASESVSELKKLFLYSFSVYLKLNPVGRAETRSSVARSSGRHSISLAVIVHDGCDVNLLVRSIVWYTNTNNKYIQSYSEHRQTIRSSKAGAYLSTSTSTSKTEHTFPSVVYRLSLRFTYHEFFVAWLICEERQSIAGPVHCDLHCLWGCPHSLNPRRICLR